jgi:hypothetical protein
LGQLVEKLDKLDSDDAMQANTLKLNSIKLDAESDAARRELLQQIDFKIREYCKII